MHVFAQRCLCAISYVPAVRALLLSSQASLKHLGPATVSTERDNPWTDQAAVHTLVPELLGSEVALQRRYIFPVDEHEHEDGFANLMVALDQYWSLTMIENAMMCV